MRSGIGCKPSRSSPPVTVFPGEKCSRSQAPVHKALHIMLLAPLCSGGLHDLQSSAALRVAPLQCLNLLQLLHQVPAPGLQVPPQVPPQLPQAAAPLHAHSPEEPQALQLRWSPASWIPPPP